MHVCEMKSFANLVYVSGGQFFLVALQQSFHFISFLASNVWLTETEGLRLPVAVVFGLKAGFLLATFCGGY